MPDEQMKEFKTSLVNEISAAVTASVVPAITESVIAEVIPAVTTAVVGELKEIIVETNQFTIDTLRIEMKEMDSNIRALITEESIKNSEMFGEVISSLDRIEESLPVTAQKVESLEKDLVLLKMEVFDYENPVEQPI